MSQRVDIRKADDPRDVIHRAVQLLAQGQLVAFPTETVYQLAAHSLRPDAVRNLLGCQSEAIAPRCTLGVKGLEEALDYVPNMSQLGRRFCRRCWPGPVTLSFQAEIEAGLLRALPAESRDAVIDQQTVSLRSPTHPVFHEISRLMPAALVLSSEHQNHLPPATTVELVEEQFGDRPDLIIDDGPCRYGEPSTVVKIENDEWKLIRPGVVTETVLRRLSSEMYLFVCTGNTCRSPMAEGLFRNLLSEKLQCSEEELVDRGYIVASAGLSATVGAPASPEAVVLLGRRGIELQVHESQPLTARLLDQADHVFTMTRSHRDAILAERPDLADRVNLLSGNGGDISDPIGGGMDEYKQCESEIEQSIRKILEQIPVK